MSSLSSAAHGRCHLRASNKTAASALNQEKKTASLQHRVLCFDFLQDGDVGVGVLPEDEEIFVGSQRPDAGVWA